MKIKKKINYTAGFKMKNNNLNNEGKN